MTLLGLVFKWINWLDRANSDPRTFFSKLPTTDHSRKHSYVYVVVFFFLQNAESLKNGSPELLHQFRESSDINNGMWWEDVVDADADNDHTDDDTTAAPTDNDDIMLLLLLLMLLLLMMI